MQARITVLAIALVVGQAAWAADLPAKQGQSQLGIVLTDAQGMTLYTFDKDESGKSACVEACAQNWPPLAAPAGAMGEGNFTVLARTDGTHQWAYKGKPLYRWIKDAKAGDTTGEGFKDMWHAARP